MKTFIQLGEDRIRMENIVAYGIRKSARYLVKRAGMVPVPKHYYESAFCFYDPDSQEDPIFDIYDRPVRIDGKTVRDCGLREDEYAVEESRVFHVELKHGRDRDYYEQTGGFDFEEVMAELDGYFLK